MRLGSVGDKEERQEVECSQEGPHWHARRCDRRGAHQPSCEGIAEDAPLPTESPATAKLMHGEQSYRSKPDQSLVEEAELMKNLSYEAFADIDLSDPFFNSLKADYKEFPTWFDAKAKSDARAYIVRRNGIQGFLYLKIETGKVADFRPELRSGRHLKVGTLKINGHGTKLGQRFVKKIFDHAIAESVDDIYVTAFAKHDPLLALLKTYGFEEHATKKSFNGEELVLRKDFSAWRGDVLFDYPRISRQRANAYLLAIYPEYHTRFLPDSKLHGESFDIVKDISHANSIHKIYLSGVASTGKLRRGDILVMYRTSDNKGPAYYRSVATSLGVVEEVRKIKSFATEADFLAYVRPYSVLETADLRARYATKKSTVIIKFTYNIALVKRLIRGRLLEDVGLPGGGRRWDFLPLSGSQLQRIASLGEVNESYFVD